MDDNTNGGNRKRRSRHQINRGNDRRRNETTNEVVNEPGSDDEQAIHEDDASLSLSLGSTSYSSQIPPVAVMSSPPLAPPFPFDRPTTRQLTVDELRAMTMMDYQSLPFSMTSPPSWLSNSLDQTEPFSTRYQPLPVNNFFDAPPSNQTTPAMRQVMMRSVTSAVRGSRSQSAGNQKSNMIQPPFPWATNIRGVIHSLEYLESRQITTITGEVQCRHCEKKYQVSCDLKEKFAEVEKIFRVMKRVMRERVPPMWTNPEHRKCALCGRERGVKPVIADRKCQINWLFMLLEQTLGYATLEQLKNFCKHSKSHRTGAKDRVLYLTYLGLCKMLDPRNELFSRETGPKR